MREHPYGRGLLATALGLIVALTPARGDEPAKPKVLIEFGWDEPDTAFLRQNIAAMERTPFDGCVFHAVAESADGRLADLAWKAWGKRGFSEAELTEAFDDLKATRLSRFTHNFLRFNTTPADLDWFDDHAAVLANARLAARLARAGRSRGILLDTEQYQGQLFNYGKQRDRGTKTLRAYDDKARLRGRELMAAFQDGFPGLTVLLTFGPSLVRAKTDGGKIPREDTEYGLLVPFLEGMAEARRGDSRIVDGHEPSYGYRDVNRFDAALEAIRSATPKLDAGFGLWLDYDHPKHGWDAEHTARNYFTPDAFETSLRAALERSDGIVWVYTEKPRWWSKDGGTVKLPEAYVAAIRRARRGLAAD